MRRTLTYAYAYAYPYPCPYPYPLPPPLPLPLPLPPTRCGRAGRTGVAHTFIVDGDESLAAPLVKLLEHNRQVVPPELIELVRATERAEHAACAREIEGVDELEEEEEALLLEQRKANRERQRQHYKERMAKEKKQQNRMYRRH